MAATGLLDDAAVVGRVLDHVDGRSTDLGEQTWREPVANYLSEARLAAEREVMRRTWVPFCPSVALAEPGAYVANIAAGTSLLAVRGEDGGARVFRNACRHRGAELAAGSGCRKAFACPYHGWTYGLDGALRHVPHQHGFPDLDKATRGLVQVACHETGGLVLVNQRAPLGSAPGEALPDLVPAGYRLSGTGGDDMPVNWKIFAEGFLEGYHIRSTHTRTFYPRQYDNLNVIERFGPNNRVTFPYRAVEKLRDVPPESRRAEGAVTYVYHLFPNVMVATFPHRVLMVVIEPVALDRTRTMTFMTTDRPDDGDGRSALTRDTDFVTAGAREDREMTCSIQRSLTSGANEFFDYGRFESAIVHFHSRLTQAVADVEVPT